MVVFSEWQKIYEEWKILFPQCEFIENFDEDYYKTIDSRKENLLILDDQMLEAGKSEYLKVLFTKGSHHRRLTVIFLVQNVYDKGNSMRTANLNAHYLIFFKNNRDKTQQRILGQQMFPAIPRFPMEVLDDATNQNSHGYIVYDLRAETDERIRIRTGIFPGETLLFYRPVQRTAGIKEERGRKKEQIQPKCRSNNSTPILFALLDQ